MRDRVEQFLSGTADASAQQHLTECHECREEIAGMQDQASLLQGLRAGSEVEPRAGFYARVMERIEAQGAESIWNMFFESPLGRRVAMASMALAVCLSVYLVSSEEMANRNTAPPSRTVMADSPDQDTVLVNLVTYQGQ
jgi:hypothetical protein